MGQLLGDYEDVWLIGTLPIETSPHPWPATKRLKWESKQSDARVPGFGIFLIAVISVPDPSLPNTQRLWPVPSYCSNRSQGPFMKCRRTDAMKHIISLLRGQ